MVTKVIQQRSKRPNTLAVMAGVRHIEVEKQNKTYFSGLLPSVCTFQVVSYILLNLLKLFPDSYLLSQELDENIGIPDDTVDFQDLQAA